MISIIICSRNLSVLSKLKENITATIGVDFEIIAIDNSTNKFSIQSAYNSGISKSVYPYLCFIHEDLLFRTLNWGQQLISHLNMPNCGIVGIAGGKIITNVPAQWSNEKSYIHILQHKKGNSTPILLKNPINTSINRESAIVVDGVFLSMKKNIVENIGFDEKIAGFHGYDYDISIQTTVAGYTNFVVYDILIEHYSSGFKDSTYYNALINVYKKWAEHLPLYTSETSNNHDKIQEIEEKRLSKLIRRMTKVGFQTSDIIFNIDYFIRILGKKGVTVKIRFIKSRIFFIKLYVLFKTFFRKK